MLLEMTLFFNFAFRSGSAKNVFKGYSGKMEPLEPLNAFSGSSPTCDYRGLSGIRFQWFQWFHVAKKRKISNHCFEGVPGAFWVLRRVVRGSIGM